MRNIKDFGFAVYQRDLALEAETDSTIKLISIVSQKHILSVQERAQVKRWCSRHNAKLINSGWYTDTFNAHVIHLMNANRIGHTIRIVLKNNKHLVCVITSFEDIKTLQYSTNDGINFTCTNSFLKVNNDISTTIEQYFALQQCNLLT